MKSLFLRLLVSLWMTMAVLGGVFAVIHASSIPAETSVGRQRMQRRTLELRAERALECQRDKGTRCDATLVPVDPRDQRLSVYRDGALVLGQGIVDAKAIIEEASREDDRMATRVLDDDEITA